jgi:hypothetical protein
MLASALQASAPLANSPDKIRGAGYFYPRNIKIVAGSRRKRGQFLDQLIMSIHGSSLLKKRQTDDERVKNVWRQRRNDEPGPTFLT